MSRSTESLLVAGLPLLAVAVTIWFVASEELNWFRLSLPLLLATFAIAGAHLYHVARHAGWWPAVGQLFLVVAVAWAAETAGQRWPVPFGARYAYHDALHPVLPGNVPLFIPLAWFALVPAPLALLRGWRRGGAAGLLAKAAAAALFLVAWDLLLDPLAVATNAWQWEHSGPYHGVPWSNFAGWFVVAFIVYTGSFLLTADHPWPGAVGLNLAFFALASVAVCRRLDNLLPIVMAVAVMIPYWLFWWRSRGAEPLPVNHG